MVENLKRYVNSVNIWLGVQLEEGVIKSKKIIQSKAYHHGNLSNDIVQTAILLIEKHGIENLSLRHAAAMCNVSASAVYRHFASKEQLLLECAAEGYARLARAMKNRKRGARQQLVQLGIGYLTFAYNHPQLFTFMFNADLSRASVEKQMIFLQSYQLLRGVVEKGVREKMFSGSVDTLTAKAWSLVHGLASLVIAKRIPVNNLKDYLELARDIFSGTIE